MGKRKERLSEGKKNIIADLICEYDIQSAEDIQDALKDLLGCTLESMLQAEPESISPTNLSIETGISKSTLATWKSKVTGGWASKMKKSTRNMSSKEKFLIVMETYTLSETELSRYCRENGLYVEQVKNWRASCIAANNGNKKNSEELEIELIKGKKKH